jgi:hypothetical protein
MRVNRVIEGAHTAPSVANVLLANVCLPIAFVQAFLRLETP